MYSYRLNLRLYQALGQVLIVGGGGVINNSMIVFPVFLYFLFVRYGMFFEVKCGFLD